MAHPGNRNCSAARADSRRSSHPRTRCCRRRTVRCHPTCCRRTPQACRHQSRRNRCRPCSRRSTTSQRSQKIRRLPKSRRSTSHRYSTSHRCRSSYRRPSRTPGHHDRGGCTARGHDRANDERRSRGHVRASVPVYRAPAPLVCAALLGSTRRPETPRRWLSSPTAAQSLRRAKHHQPRFLFDSFSSSRPPSHPPQRGTSWHKPNVHSEKSRKRASRGGVESRASRQREPRCNWLPSESLKITDVPQGSFLGGASNCTPRARSVS